MTKKKSNKKHRPLTKGFGVTTKKLDSQLIEVDKLLAQTEWEKAEQLLDSLKTLYPNEPKIYRGYVNLYYELGDLVRYEAACKQLVELDPNNKLGILGLAGAYLSNIRPMLALQTFRRFLDRWPEDQRAAKVRETVANLEAKMDELIADMKLSEGENPREMMALLEEAQSFLSAGNYLEAERKEEEVLQRVPDYPPALNNLSFIYAKKGELSRAIACSERVLEVDPDNFHALANLTRYLLISGEPEAARKQAEKLKAIDLKDNNEIFGKKAEAFSFFGDDRAVLELFANAEKQNQLDSSFNTAFLYHLTAVASMRLGNETQAQKYWQRSLQLHPGLEVAEENLRELMNLLPSDRHAPWPFPVANWMSEASINDLREWTEIVNFTESDEEDRENNFSQEYFQQHPEMLTLLPILFDRGDPAGRTFAFQSAKGAKTPETLAALRDFALSDRGPDRLRLEAGQVVVNEGLLPSSEPLRMWMKGQWQELILFSFEVSDDPKGNHSEPVVKFLAEALEALHNEEAVKAEQLLEQALEIEPDSPDLLNNLAVTYNQQGQEEKAYALIKEIHERFPDYSIARISLAFQMLEENKIPRAEELLKPLLSQKHFHYTEYGLFCRAQVYLALYKEEVEAAQYWLNMWEHSEPENAEIKYLRSRLGELQELQSMMDDS